MIRLISEHIELNKYCFKYNIKSTDDDEIIPENELCKYCKNPTKIRQACSPLIQLFFGFVSVQPKIFVDRENFFCVYLLL